MGFLLKISYFFLLCVECNYCRHSYLCRIGRMSGVRCYYSGRHRQSLYASGLRSPELSAQVGRANSCVCACVCVLFPFVLDVRFVGRISRSHTGFLIHLPSAVHALIFLAGRIQPFLSPFLSTRPLHTNSGCGKERRILIGPW